MAITIQEKRLVPVRRDGQYGGVSVGSAGGGISGVSGTSGTSGISGISGHTNEELYWTGTTLFMPTISIGGYMGLSGTNEYYVATSSGGSPTTKLTFINGILISDT